MKAAQFYGTRWCFESSNARNGPRCYTATSSQHRVTFDRSLRHVTELVDRLHCVIPLYKTSAFVFCAFCHCCYNN